MRKKRKMGFHTYTKLPKSSKQLIDITHETEKTSISTLTNIALACQNRNGQPINNRKLLHELSALEKIGILKRVIINRNDEPVLVWKTQITFE